MLDASDSPEHLTNIRYCSKRMKSLELMVDGVS
jgi:hypothetical protein